MLRYAKTSLLLLVLVSFLAGSTVGEAQLVGDLDGNYRVDLMDLRTFARQWLDPGCLVPGCVADLDNVNGVNMADYALLAKNWQIKESHLVINEFLASNNNTMLDGDNQSSDWIELYNPTDTTVSLDGWYLTDYKPNLTMWQFPDGLEVEPGRFLIVFASEKTQELYPDNYPYLDSLGYYHTNFELNKGGDYLALVGADGNAIAHEFTLEYPVQLTDISYGLAQNATTLVPTGAIATYHVPTSSDAGTDWTAVDFIDPTWEAGPTSIGFGDVSGATGTILREYWTGIAGTSVLDLTSSANYPDNPSGSSEPAFFEAPINWADHYGTRMRGFLYPATTGDYTFWISTDDNGELWLSTDADPAHKSMICYVPGWTNSREWSKYAEQRSSSIALTAGQRYYIEALQKEHESGDNLAVTWEGPGIVKGDPIEGQYLSPWTGDLISTDVQGDMLGINASLWTRIEFFLEEGKVGAFDTLMLRMKYEDGFVAFLNGQEVASRNAPNSIDWNSTALSDRPDYNASVFEEINLNPFLGTLKTGINVLAIQGLNDDKNNGDFLILPELVAASNMSVPQYFTQPTPGTFNISGAIGVVSDVWFSHESGFYDELFLLILSTAMDDAEIRYTTDGSWPTITHGTVYTGPLLVSETTTIRAAAFKPGWLPANIETQAYMFIEPDVRNFSSNLPIALIDTFGGYIGQSTQTLNFAGFIDRTTGGRARITDPTDFIGRAGINVRGKSSAGFPKKQYHFETWDEYDQDKDVSILDFPAESDWILQGPYSDKSLMRNVMSYRWSNDVGRYAVRTRFIEMFLNTDGGKISMSDYVGAYVLMEKIKRNKNRVDITRLEPTDNTEPDITGGYIIKKDKFDADDLSFYTSSGQNLIYVEPAAAEITQAQKNWIKNYLDEYESVLYGPNFTDPVDGYTKYIDVGSFFDHHILVELTKNIDGFRLSTYMFKDRGGKLNMGPVWDYNLSLGNADYLEGWIPQGWYNSLLSDYDYPWWRRLFQDPEFRLYYADRWFGLRRTLFATDRLLQNVDNTAALLNEAQARNFSRWPILGTYVWPNWFIAQTYQEEIDWMKGWLEDRLTWMDAQIATEFAAAPPQFNQQGGQVNQDFNLTMTASSGTIYYTLDGNDPRLPENLQISSTTLVAEDAVKRVLVPTETVDENWKGGGAFDDSGWNDGTFIPDKTGGVGYDEDIRYEPYISYDVESLMNADLNPSANTSCYIRVPFYFDGDPGEFNFMTLYIRYDDGFIAYINGTELVEARRNFAGTPNWDSGADSIHDDSAAVNFESIPISSYISALKQGNNILAIHGLNYGASSSDFLISVELVAGEANSTGGISPSAIEYNSEPITFNKSTQVKARILDGSTWSALNEAIFAVGPVAENLRITEIMYHPKNTGDVNDPNTEYIELTNIGPDIINLNLVRFTEGIDFTFPAIELESGGHIVVVKDIAAFEAKYGTSVNKTGPYIGSLANDGERIRLEDAIGQTILDFEYEDGWRAITDGGGFSLTIIDPTDKTLYGWEEDLVAHWKFDDGAGMTATDSAGTNNGTLIGDPTWTTGRIGGALSFDGIGDYVSVAPIGPLAGVNFTAQAWVNVDASAGVWNPVLMQHNLSNNGCYFYVAYKKPSFYIISDSSFVQAASLEVLNADQWYHVAATNDGSDLRMYVDGQLKGSGSSAGMTGVNYDAYIGCEPVSLLHYIGLIDDVRIYDRSISEIEFKDISDPMARWSRKDSWRASVYRNGSPGYDDSGMLPNPGAVAINEVMSHSNDGPDWIELYNTTDEPINIGGWFLSDNDRDEPNLMKYRIADGTMINGNNYLVFYQNTDFDNLDDPGCLVPFALSENGGEACLSSHLDLNVMLTGYREVEDFGASATNVSFGRYFKSSTGNFNFVAMDSNTPDSNNTYPKVGPVVINEIMYNPPSGNQKEEYIELYNITGAAVTLWRLDKNTSWKFTDGIDYTFSSSPTVTILPNRYLLVVKDMASFTARYGIISGVQIVEDYDGWLSNAGERLQIGMPGDIDDEGTRQYIRIDRVNYSDGSHPEDCPGGVDLWPTEADGLGESLSRKVPTDYGNDVGNWEASTPTPGIANP